MEARRWTIRAALAGALAALAAAVAGALAPAGAKDAYLGGLATPGGVTVSGSPYRYVAISPRTRPRQTVIERIELAGGRVSRWWYLRGGWGIPAGSYRADGAGLSADGGTLVLTALEEGRPRWPPRTRLAILDTELHLRDPQRSGGSGRAHAVRRITLPGEYEVAAVSPDGETAYLARIVAPHRFGAPPRPGEGGFRIHALDLRTGKLAPAPLLSRDGWIATSGTPIDRVSSRDGRWSYGLYVEERGELFLLGIDTVAGRIARVDLPRLRASHQPFGFRLRVSGDGGRLIVFRSDLSARGHSAPLATVALPIAASAEPDPVRHGPLGFLFTPVQPGNLMSRAGVAGQSADGHEIRVRQWGDPARPATLAFGCAGGRGCAGARLEPRFVASNGCPDPAANLVLVPRPRSQAGLARRLVRTLEPRATLWFHRHAGPAFVRAWGQSAPAGRRFAQLAGLPFHLLPWPAGALAGWQNRAFPEASSFVVELPPGPLPAGLARRLGAALARAAHEVGEHGYVAQKG